MQSLISSDSEISDSQKAELEDRFSAYKLLFEQYTTIQDELELFLPDTQLDDELLEREEFENRYYSIIGQCKCILKSNDSYSTSTQNAQSQVRVPNGMKLPTITLPKFDGTYDQWLEFRDTYLSMIHNSESLENIQKFHYLRSVLTGDALQVVKALEFTTDNYLVAWSLLENRYNNDRLLQQNHVNAILFAEPLIKESATSIRKLIDLLLRNIRALKTLEEPTEHWDTLIILIIVPKLDSLSEHEWERYKGTLPKDRKLKLSDMMTFLQDRADFLEAVVKPNKKQTADAHTTHTKKPSNTKSHSHVVTHKENKRKTNSSQRFKCDQCGSNHPLFSCEDFLSLSLEDKLKFIEEKKLCRNCLRTGHALNECWYGPCRHCNKKHNTLIHKDAVVDTPSTSSAVAQITQIEPQSECDTSTTHIYTPLTTSHKSHTLYKDDNNINAHCFQTPVLLSTALVEIADTQNKYHTTRALLDNGSQHCFISESLCRQLNLPLIQSTVQVIGVGNTISKSTQSCHIQLRSKTNSYHTSFNCLVLPRITAQLPSLGGNHNIDIPGNVQLADPEFYKSNEIKLLLGADRFWDLLSEGLIRLPNGPLFTKHAIRMGHIGNRS